MIKTKLLKTKRQRKLNKLNKRKLLRKHRKKKKQQLQSKLIQMQKKQLSNKLQLQILQLMMKHRRSQNKKKKLKFQLLKKLKKNQKSQRNHQKKKLLLKFRMIIWEHLLKDQQMLLKHKLFQNNNTKLINNLLLTKVILKSKLSYMPNKNKWHQIQLKNFHKKKVQQKAHLR